MEHEYIFEKKQLPSELQNRVEDESIDMNMHDFCCPYCGSVCIYEGYLAEFGNMTYVCDSCGSEMTVHELNLS